VAYRGFTQLKSSNVVFDFSSRLKKLQRMLQKGKFDACLLASSHGVDASTYYFCGDQTNPTYLFITPESTAIASLHEKDFSDTFDQCIPLNNARQKLKELVGDKKVRMLAVDDSSETAGMAVRYQKLFPKLKVTGISQELSRMRNIKEPAEIALIQKAQSITNRMLDEAETKYANGRLFGKTENGVAGWMEYRTRELGASLDSFTPMVLAGERSAFFHNATSQRRIDKHELVLADVGARLDGYCADATRTWYSGKDKQIKDALHDVQESKDAAWKKARIGATGKQVSDAALNVLVESGWADYSFRKAGLSLGHFVGLRVHDGTAFEKEKLAAGMVFTIEPGVYILGKFGVRLEDVLVLCDD
jgi:Xaa-Pro aminopeptidase